MGRKTNKQPRGDGGIKMNEFLAGVTLCLSVHLCGCVCMSVNEPFRAKAGGPPTTLLQDNFTAIVNLQESHQCVSECVLRHMRAPMRLCLLDLYACVCVCVCAMYVCDLNQCPPISLFAAVLSNQNRKGPNKVLQH